MKKLKILILCAAAMSSAFIVDAMNEAAKEQGLDVDIECFASLRYRYFDYTAVDFVLLAPQVRGQKDDVEKFIRGQGATTPIELIPMREYGMMQGGKILQLVLDRLAPADKA